MEGHSLYPFDILLPYEDQDPHWGVNEAIHFSVFTLIVI